MREGEEKMKKQMSLSQFVKECGISRSTSLEMIHRSAQFHPLPAYKIGGRWYIDMEQYEKWRETEDFRQRNDIADRPMPVEVKMKRATQRSVI